MFYVEIFAENAEYCADSIICTQPSNFERKKKKFIFVVANPFVAFFISFKSKRI